MTKFIGVDLGTMKCGFSIGNDITCTARPLETSNFSNLEDFLEYILDLSKEQGVYHFILGDPTANHPGVHPLENSIKVIKGDEKRLLEKHQLQITWIEESYTSQLATALAKEYPKHTRDALAATLILQSYLNQL